MYKHYISVDVSVSKYARNLFRYGGKPYARRTTNKILQKETHHLNPA